MRSPDAPIVVPDSAGAPFVVRAPPRSGAVRERPRPFATPPPRSTCVDGIWCEDALPEAMSRAVVGGVWGTSARALYAVGWDGHIARHDGRGWSIHGRIPGAQLVDVAGTGPDDVYVLARDGDIHHFAGKGWAHLHGSGRKLSRLFVHRSHVVATGDAGTLITRTNGRWHASRTAAPLNAVAGAGPEAWRDVVVSNRGFAGIADDRLWFRGIDQQWRPISVTPSFARSVWAGDDDEVVLGLDHGTLALRHQSAWLVTKVDALRHPVRVWGIDGHVFAAGGVGAVVHKWPQHQLEDAVTFCGQVLLPNTKRVSCTRRHGVVDLSPLVGLDSLRELDLTNANVTDLSALRALGTLYALHVNVSAVPDLSPIASLVQLRILSLAGTGGRTLDLLRPLDKLFELSLRGVVGTIEGVQHLVALLDLDLAFSDVSDLSPLTGVSRLRRIDLIDTPVTDLSPLRSCAPIAVTLGNARAAATQLAALRATPGVVVDEH